MKPRLLILGLRDIANTAAVVCAVVAESGMFEQRLTSLYH